MSMEQALELMSKWKHSKRIPYRAAPLVFGSKSFEEGYFFLFMAARSELMPMSKSALLSSELELLSS